jgi:hypothetical protein
MSQINGASPQSSNPLVSVAEKLEILPRSAMLTSRYRPVRSVGSWAFALLMLSSVKHTKWLYSRGSVPQAQIASRSPNHVSTADIELCERLIAAYQKAKELDQARNATDGMWSWIHDTRQKELASVLDDRDAQALAGLMVSMHNQDFVLGMASGPLIRQTESSRLARRAWIYKSLDGLASLGEVLGVVPVENPEQGGAGLALSEGLPALFDAIEEKLGFPLDFPDVGAACGLQVDGRLITPDTPDQIYAALRLSEGLNLYVEQRNGGAGAPKVVEIGGGYGGMCHWFLKVRPNTERYTIVDLPIVGVLQGYFLGRSLGADRVSLYGEPPATVRIMPNLALEEVETPFDVLANKDSLPEMPDQTMRDYLRWGARHCTGTFYSYNQEARQEFLGEPQGVVHEAVSAEGGFERVRRERAWVRDGYVEEFYLPEA